MKMSKYLLILPILLVFCVAQAEQVVEKSLFARGTPEDIFEFGGGWYDINDNWKAASAHVIYKSHQRIYDALYPIVGVMATSKGAFHNFVGVGMDLYLNDNIVISPSFAPGVYHNGSGKKLGLWLQFKSMIELGFEMENHHRVALGLYHISNANLGKTNQGTEVLTLTYSLPFEK